MLRQAWQQFRDLNTRHIACNRLERTARFGIESIDVTGAALEPEQYAGLSLGDRAGIGVAGFRHEVLQRKVLTQTDAEKAQ